MEMVQVSDSKRKQRGFTLIEIIAVLVILGILAAVAVPKYYDLQEKSRTNSLMTACAAANSNVSLRFAQEVVNNGKTKAEASGIAYTDDVVKAGITDYTFSKLASGKTTIKFTAANTPGTYECTVVNPGAE